MDPIVAVILIIVAVVAGVAAGWLLGGRSAAPLRDELEKARADGESLRGDAATWRDKFNQAIVDLAGTAEQAKRLPQLEAQLEQERRSATEALTEAANLRPHAERAPLLDRELHELRAEKEALARAKAAYERGESERQQAHEAQLGQLRDLETKVEGRFAELASKAVDGAHDKFLKQAAERFGHAEKQSEEKLKSLLQPVESTLKRYDEKLDQIEKARNSSYGELQAAVQLLHQGHTQVRDEARNLISVLRGNSKSRGNWGERSLKNVLEQAGLSPFADFQTEVSVDTEDGRLRPDVIIRLPGGRRLVIDAKCSLNAYLDANEAEDEETRRTHLKRHAASVRNHVQQLGAKSYWERFGDAADFVVMYIPGEHFLHAALENDDGDLWSWAFERRVLLASPINLIGLARTVAMEWRKENLAEQAAEIAKLGKELHSRIATMGAHVERVGRNLGQATNAYNAFVGSLETQVMTQAKRFESLEVASGAKEIEPLPVIETSPRTLAKLTGSTADDLADAAE